jgi:uncharacterized protein YdaU (DUF1376 family)
MPSDEHESYDWPEECTVIQEVNATAVYVNVNGAIVIRQRLPYVDDVYVVIPRAHVQAVVDAWYVGDARAKMRRLSLTERGAYRELLDEIYATGEGLPESVEELCRIAGAQGALECRAVEAVAIRYLPVGPDGLRHNKRATAELAKQADFKAKQSAKGTSGAMKRWENAKRKT